jgi:hypothetical protein
MRAPDTYFQVLEDEQAELPKEERRPVWHAAAVSSSVLCGVTRRRDVTRWEYGTDKVNCGACLALLEDRPGPDWRAIP